MEKFFEQIPKIISEAAKKPLAIIALLILAASTVGVTLFQDAGEQTRLIAFALIIGSFGLFVYALLVVNGDNPHNDEIKESDGSETQSTELVITPLTGSSRLMPLDGHKPIQREGMPTVYTEGLRATFNLSHNGEGKETIILNYLGVKLLNYLPGANPKYAYQIQNSQIIGAGTAKVHEFSVSLFEEDVGRAQKVIDAKKGKYVQAGSSNFFDTQDATVFEFRSGSGDNETLKVNVVAIDPGFYEFCFIFIYTAGGVDKEYITDSLFIYREG